MGSRILLTGKPGCGKTMAIKSLLSQLDRPAGGFFTQEIRQNGVRTGFEIVTLDQQRGRLAEAGLASEYQVGRYGVDLAFLEDVGIPTLYKTAAESHLVVLDEIGPMEIFSMAFQQCVLDLLSRGCDLVGTIVERPYPFADQIKQLPDVDLIELQPDNRAALIDRLKLRFG